MVTTARHRESPITENAFRVLAGTAVVVLGDYGHALAPRLEQLFQGTGVTVQSYADHVNDEDVLFERLRAAHVAVVIRERTRLPATLLRRLSNLELVVTTGSNTSVVDLDAGVPVCATRSMASAPAELTWALILTISRRLEEETANLRAGHWQHTVGAALEGKRLGILGLGRIGSRVARVAQAFDMKVLAWSRSLTTEAAARQGVQAVAKEALFTESDIISLHLRLGESSRGIIDAEALSLMKDHAILVNTARAGLIDQAALVSALHSGKLDGFAQDVFSEEPLPADSELLNLPRAVLTPHLGYVTDRNVELFARDVHEDIRAFYAGAPVRALN